MANAKKCDICGKYFDVKNKTVNYIKTAYKDTCGLITNGTSVDACPQCAKSIEDCIESLKPVKAEPKTVLEVVTCKGYLHFYDRDSLGRDKEVCVVTVILNKNGQVNKIYSVVTDDWEYKCEVDIETEEFMNSDGSVYEHKTEKFMWYRRRLNQPHDGWIFIPNIAYLEYQI